jgi:acyl carrier protein
MDALLPEGKKKIREFIATYLAGESFTDDDDLFATGYVNSLFALELVTFVEKHFLIVIEDEELNLDNFRSVSAIASLVYRKVKSE